MANGNLRFPLFPGAQGMLASLQAGETAVANLLLAGPRAFGVNLPSPPLPFGTLSELTSAFTTPAAAEPPAPDETPATSPRATEAAEGTRRTVI